MLFFLYDATRHSEKGKYQPWFSRREKKRDKYQRDNTSKATTGVKYKKQRREKSIPAGVTRKQVFHRETFKFGLGG